MQQCPANRSPGAKSRFPRPAFHDSRNRCRSSTSSSIRYAVAARVCRTNGRAGTRRTPWPISRSARSPRSSCARALTGDAYFGHVFWDTEIYLLPFYTAVWPEAARALLMYRYRTLPAARAKAAHFGYRGALYAWESADTGEETTPETVLGSAGETIEIL